jgi:endonuclease YncB( thermonuclease family)
MWRVPQLRAGGRLRRAQTQLNLNRAGWIGIVKGWMMRRFALVICALLTGITAAQRSHAQDAAACTAQQDDSKAHADILALLPDTPATREDSVNYRVTGKVRSITDGDTVTLTGRRNARFVIRLSDLDAPETSHQSFTPRDCKCAPVPFRPGQAGGEQATEALRSLLAIGEEVTAECYELDDYGRSVCHLFKGRVNINLEMIRMGWGRLPERRAWIRDEASAAAEQAARSAGLGAWGLGGQLSPAEWRQQCWRNGKCDAAVNRPDMP